MITREQVELLFKYHLKKQPADGPLEAEKALELVSIGLDIKTFYKDIKLARKNFNIKKVGEITYKD